MKKFIPLLILILLFAAGLHFSELVLLEKTTYGSARNIADEEPHQIDVAILGSSHVMYGIDPSVIWDRTGIAAYDLTTQQQPLYAGQILLEHTLKTQEPKLVVLDVIMAMNMGKLLDDAETAANMTHLVLDPMPLSPGKIRSILQTEEITAKNEMVFPIIFNHSRLQQGLLRYRDWHYPFARHPHMLKGYKFTTANLPYEKPSVITEGTLALPEQTEKSLRNFIEFCLEKHLPLLLIKTPMVGDDEFFLQLNRIEEIAKEYDLPFLNLNLYYDEMSLDFETDFADKGHMNADGARKVSAFLADYLSEHYDLTDHRNDPSYESWNVSSAHVGNLYDLPGMEDVPEYLSRLSDPNLLTVIASGGRLIEEQSCLPEEMVTAFDALGLEQMPKCTGEGAYYAILDGGVLQEEVLKDRKDLETNFILEDTRFVIYANTEEPDGARRMVNAGYSKTGHLIRKPGIVVMTWDKDSMTEVDSFYLDAGKDYSVSRKFQKN